MVRVFEILIVEDNPDDLFFLKLCLKRAHISNPLVVAADGRAAIAHLTGKIGTPEQLPGLVFLDLKLPLVSGLEVLAWIRENALTAQIPVIVLSSSAEGRDTQRARTLGANAYCLKLPPVDAFARLGDAMMQPDWPVGIRRAGLPSLC